MSEQPADVRAKILIAESDTIVSLDLQGMIMRMGYDVVALVDSGAEAIAAIKRFHPDIVLLGMVLNGAEDGVQTARGIHEASDIPVVFCLSNADLPALVRAKELAYAGYLLKPINPDSLATTIDTVFYKYKLEKRVQRAEEKSRSLERLNLILSGLSETGSCAEWTWAPGAALAFSGESVDAAIRSLAPRLESLAASVAAASRSPEASACLLTDGSAVGGGRAYASLAVRAGDGVSGLVIRLSRDEGECLRT